MITMDEHRRLLKLSYSNPKGTQSNTVVHSQKEMDRVGFEPTTSAMPRLTRAGILNIIDTIHS